MSSYFASTCIYKVHVQVQVHAFIKYMALAFRTIGLLFKIRCHNMFCYPRQLQGTRMLQGTHI